MSNNNDEQRPVERFPCEFQVCLRTHFNDFRTFFWFQVFNHRREQSPPMEKSMNSVFTINPKRMFLFVSLSLSFVLHRFILKFRERQCFFFQVERNIPFFFFPPCFCCHIWIWWNWWTKLHRYRKRLVGWSDSLCSGRCIVLFNWKQEWSYWRRNTTCSHWRTSSRIGW